MTVQLFCGDCLEIMPKLADKSIDAVICDPPYGTTSAKWDFIIPLESMWAELIRLSAKQSPILLFCSQPFTSDLIVSNKKMYRHSWIWNKKQSGSFFNAKFGPLRITEDIAVFSEEKPSYYPIMTKGKMRMKGGAKEPCKTASNGLMSYSTFNNEYYPTNILEFPNCSNKQDNVHPTQKPVELMEYLIKTYTREGETVLDFTCGSGSTGVAAVNLGRSFIGIEKDPQYFEIAKERIAEAERRKNNEFFVKKPTAPTLFDFMLEDKQ
jgi:DNA modification methylase